MNDIERRVRWERDKQRAFEHRTGMVGVWIASIAGLLLILGGGNQDTWVAIVELGAVVVGGLLTLNLRENTS